VPQPWIVGWITGGDITLLKGGEKMGMNVDAIFQIAGMGIIVAMIHTVLKSSGREDWANWVTLIGIIVVLFMVASYINDLFQEIKRVFLFK
jgi:stage III sporulation protein AC